MSRIDAALATNAVKEAAASRRMIRGVHFTFPAPPAIEVLAPLELDFIYLDGEHGSFDTRDLEAATVAAERHGMVPIARVPDPSASTITRFLDRGIRGIVLPHIDSVADAKAALDAIYFAPLGNRSFGGGRPHYLAIPDQKAHLAACNRNVSVCVMIESIGGLEAAAEIAALPGVDYLSFGMNDFAQALGYPGEPAHPEVMRRFREGKAAINAAGKPVRDDFMQFTWINQAIVEGTRALLGKQGGKAY